LYPLLQKISVQLRGWDFPHLDTQTRLHIDKDWIGQEIEWNHYLELWRFYQSGQFVHFSGMHEDWRDQSELWPSDKDWKPGLDFIVHDAVFRFTEALDLAARLALTEAGDGQMHLEVTVSGLDGRTLCNLPGRWPFHQKRTAYISELPYKVDLPQLQLITEPGKLALKPAVEVFRRFGWDPGLDVLRDIQAELLRRGQRLAGRP
jgi:hypothetical protein